MTICIVFSGDGSGHSVESAWTSRVLAEVEAARLKDERIGTYQEVYDIWIVEVEVRS